jgi:hypothetical protein
LSTKEEKWVTAPGKRTLGVDVPSHNFLLEQVIN